MGNKVVVDSSFVLKWFKDSNEGDTGSAREIYDLMVRGQIKVFAPKLLILEVANVMIKRFKLPTVMVKKAIKLLVVRPICYVEVDMNNVFDLVKNMVSHDLTAYDSAYLTIAKKLQVPLITYDKQLLMSYDKAMDAKSWLLGAKISS